MQFFTKSTIAAILFAASAFAADAPVEGDPTKITGVGGDAKAYPSNPTKTYWADFSGTGKVGGRMVFTGTEDKGIKVEVRLTGLPREGGPFSYHVHDEPVPEDGNCTLTKAHLDPFIRGQKVPCDPKRPASCEVGDLAGKHGKIPADTNGTYTNDYDDLYITLTEGQGSFIGNRSIVIHTNDTKRYACVNIVEFQDDSAGGRIAVGAWGIGLAVAMGLNFLF